MKPSAASEGSVRHVGRLRDPRPLMQRAILFTAVLALFQARSVGQTQSGGQTSSGEATFEVASVKRSDAARNNLPPNVCSGGPGSPDPVLLRCTNAPLGVFVSIAYDLQFYELIEPDWMKLGGAESGYDLSAKIAAGATKEQYRIMLRNLLAERFHLTAHRETRNVPRYAVALGKGPAKLQDPIAKPPGGRAYGMQFAEGHIRFDGYRLSLKQFAGFLTTMLSGPVTDETNLQGDYSFTLEFTPDDRWPGYSPQWASTQKGEPAPNLFTAVQDQLGLKLESTKGPLEVLVMDHADKIPAEN